MKYLSGIFIAATLALSGPEVSGIIFVNESDSDFNTTAPTGELEDSGWQYQGNWGNFLGTAIGPHHFVTVKHVGGSAGDIFHFQGRDYLAVESFDAPDSTLRIWRVCGTLPIHAPLYDSQDETGQSVVVFGRGVTRGEEVLLTDPVLGDELKGWKWSSGGRQRRWGENVIEDIVSQDGVNPLPGGSQDGSDSFLKAPFDENGGDNEAHLSNGDSGGGVFIQDGDVWKLAGLNFAVDGPYNTSDSGAGFSAAIFDEGGLYKKDSEGNWQQEANTPVVNQPGAFYATRISTNLEWINGILSQSSDSSLPTLFSADEVPGPFQEVGEAEVDGEAKTITVPPQNAQRFYVLSHCAELEIVQISFNDSGAVVLEYQ